MPRGAPAPPGTKMVVGCILGARYLLCCEAPPKDLSWADSIAMDHNILNEEDASRESDQTAFIMFESD